MNWEELSIRLLAEKEEIPYSLLLMADPSLGMVDAYLKSSDLYVAERNGEILGAYVLYPLDLETIEIKNIAVAEFVQGQGLGQLLLEHAERMARNKGFGTLLIGTANSSIGQLYLYQKMGFELLEIRKGFFLENYATALWENGIQVKDMIVLKKNLLSKII